MDELDFALDDCLQKMGTGKWSLGQCLAHYPQFAAELRPLLETALQLQQGKMVRPSGAMRDRLRTELVEHVKAHPRRPHKGSMIPRTAAGLLLVAIAVLFATTAFAQGALPGQALYRYKLSTERLWRAASANHVQTDLRLADRRTQELITLAHQLDSQVYNTSTNADAQTQAITAYADVLDRLAAESEGPEADLIFSSLQDHQYALSQAGIHVQALDEVLSRVQLKHRQGGSPTSKP